MSRLCALPTLLLAAFLFGGCVTSTTGTKIDAEKIAQIKKGVSTRAEIEQLFGQPESVTLSPDGKRILLYRFSEIKAGPIISGPFMGTMGKMDNKEQILQIILTASNVVEDYEFSDRTKKTEESGYRSTTK